MNANHGPFMRTISLLFLLSAVLAFFWAAATAAPGAVSPNFQYNIINIEQTSPGQFPVVTFSVTDPTNGNQAYDIKTDPAFTQTATGVSRLALQIGWDTRDYTNAGSGSNRLPVGAGASLPIPIDALLNSVSNGDGTFTATSAVSIPLDATGTGVVAMEGHPAGPDAGGAYTVRLQVKSVFAYFTISPAGGPIVPRRSLVDINNCLQCHGTLSLHGDNRVNEIGVCVVCHNANQTDIPFRQDGDGPEVSVDFKFMVHAIHAGSMRENPYIVIGRNHSLNDYSEVVFPAELSNCLNCHIDGAFELPLDLNVLGTTIDTSSVITPGGKLVDADPANDLNVSPIAAVCSGCHDSGEARQHMERMGASFSALQSQIDSGQVSERCVSCHGPGQEEDVREVHEIGQVVDPTETPEPTETAEPTEEPEPTETPRMTRTPGPTKTPKMTHTSEPTKTPRPTRTPRATVMPRQRIEFTGPVQERPVGNLGLWLIDDRRVLVDASTRLDEKQGPAVVGATVQVIGLRTAAGEILAIRIKTKDNNRPEEPTIKFQGPIEQLPAGGLLGIWQVAGHTFTVGPDTELEYSPSSYAVGVFVQVHGVVSADGAIAAREIEIEEE